MLDQESVYQWMNYHAAAFPSWQSQLTRLREEAKRFAIERIQRAFDGMTLPELKRSTDRMASWENTPKLDQHVLCVARLVKEDRLKHAQARGEVSGSSCPWCLGSGIACLYAGCYPVTRERYGEQSRWERVGVPCFCDASRVCNHWLREWHDKIPNGMEHRSRLTDEHRQAVELGPDWFAAPEWQVAYKGGRMEF